MGSNELKLAVQILMASTTEIGSKKHGHQHIGFQTNKNGSTNTEAATNKKQCKYWRAGMNETNYERLMAVMNEPGCTKVQTPWAGMNFEF